MKELKLKNTTVSQIENLIWMQKINIGEATKAIKPSIYDKRKDFDFKLVTHIIFVDLSTLYPYDKRCNVYKSFLWHCFIFLTQYF